MCANILGPKELYTTDSYLVSVNPVVTCFSLKFFLKFYFYCTSSSICFMAFVLKFVVTMS